MESEQRAYKDAQDTEVKLTLEKIKRIAARGQFENLKSKGSTDLTPKDNNKLNEALKNAIDNQELIVIKNDGLTHILDALHSVYYAIEAGTLVMPRSSKSQVVTFPALQGKITADIAIGKISFFNIGVNDFSKGIPISTDPDKLPLIYKMSQDLKTAAIILGQNPNSKQKPYIKAA